MKSEPQNGKATTTDEATIALMAPTFERIAALCSSAIAAGDPDKSAVWAAVAVQTARAAQLYIEPVGMWRTVRRGSTR